MAITADQLKAYEEKEAAHRRLPIFLGAFDEETSAEKLIAEARAVGDRSEAEPGGRHGDRWPAMCGCLQAQLDQACRLLHELQHRPGETKARATRKRLFREAMSRRAA